MSKKNTKQVKKVEIQVLGADVEAACKAAGVKPSRKRARVAVLETEHVAEEKPVETDANGVPVEISISDLKPFVEKPVETVVEEKPVEKKPLTAEEKRAKRNEYARKYYEAHREKLAEASRLCHARKRAAMKAAKLEAANENK